MKIYTPVKNFDGIRASVRFTKGVGETNDPKLIEWFKRNGYTVEKSVESREDCIEKLVEECTEPDFETMTPIELREWMRENGYGSKIKNIRNKEKLLEILRG
jgi:hypothetical protein